MIQFCGSNFKSLTKNASPILLMDHPASKLLRRLYFVITIPHHGLRSLLVLLSRLDPILNCLLDLEAQSWAYWKKLSWLWWVQNSRNLSDSWEFPTYLPCQTQLERTRTYFPQFWWLSPILNHFSWHLNSQAYLLEQCYSDLKQFWNKFFPKLALAFTSPSFCGFDVDLFFIGSTVLISDLFGQNLSLLNTKL